jgi:hypothetical protein
MAVPFSKELTSKNIMYDPFTLLILACKRTIVPTFPVIGTIEIIVVSALTYGKNERVITVDVKISSKNIKDLTFMNGNFNKFFPS